MVCINNYSINLSGYYPIYMHILNIYDIICGGACCRVVNHIFIPSPPHPNLITATHAVCCTLSNEIGVQGRWGGKSTITTCSLHQYMSLSWIMMLEGSESTSQELYSPFCYHALPPAAPTMAEKEDPGSPKHLFPPLLIIIITHRHDMD